METKDRQKILLITAAAGLALLVGNSVVLGPLQQSWTNRSKEIATLKQNLDDGRNLLLRKTGCNHAGRTCRPIRSQRSNSAGSACQGGLPLGPGQRHQH